MLRHLSALPNPLDHGACDILVHDNPPPCTVIIMQDGIGCNLRFVDRQVENGQQNKNPLSLSLTGFLSARSIRCFKSQFSDLRLDVSLSMLNALDVIVEFQRKNTHITTAFPPYGHLLKSSLNECGTSRGPLTA